MGIDKCFIRDRKVCEEVASRRARDSHKKLKWDEYEGVVARIASFHSVTLASSDLTIYLAYSATRRAQPVI